MPAALVGEQADDRRGASGERRAQSARFGLDVRGRDFEGLGRVATEPERQLRVGELELEPVERGDRLARLEVMGIDAELSRDAADRFQ